MVEDQKQVQLWIDRFEELTVATYQDDAVPRDKIEATVHIYQDSAENLSDNEWYWETPKETAQRAIEDLAAEYQMTLDVFGFDFSEFFELVEHRAWLQWKADYLQTLEQGE